MIVSKDFEEHWFTEDNNFINDSAQIDSILKDNSDIAVDYKFDNDDFKQAIHSLPITNNKTENR